MKILIAYDGSDFANAIPDDLRYAGLPPCAEVAVIILAEPEDFLVGKKTEGVVGWFSCRLAGRVRQRGLPGIAWSHCASGHVAPVATENRSNSHRLYRAYSQ
jgi:hypothetical protein